MMAGARDPWWIIGSAAVVLLGVVTTVADVDLLLSTADADAVAAARDLTLRRDAGDDRFSSTRYGRWSRPRVPIEFMADLRVNRRPLRPATRVAATVNGATVYHPDRAEMIAILYRFGRPKDLARAELLG